MGLNFMGIDNLDPYLYEARIIFEPEICSLSAQRATDAEIKILQKLSDSIDELDKQLQGEETDETIIKKLYEKDKAFHIMICRTCQNPVLERLMPIIIQSISLSYNPSTFPLITKYVKQSPPMIRIRHAHSCISIFIILSIKGSLA